MKKLLMIVAAVAMCVSAKCQLNAGFNIGVNVPTAGIALPGFVQIEKDGTQKVLVATLGAGVNYNLSLGYHLNDNVTSNIDFGYFSSFNGGFYQYADFDGNESRETKLDISFKGKFTHITPNFVFRANNNGNKLQPYARFGLIMGWAKVESTLRIQNTPGKNVGEWSGGTSFGFLGGIGLNKNITSRSSLFLELTTKTITAYPKKLTNLENFGGPKEPTVNYADEIGPDSGDNDSLTFPIPYSSLGLSLGLVYNMGK